MVILLDKTDHFKIDRKISYKSLNCKQDPKIMTREDEEEDEEEEDEEEEDDGLTLDDVKDVADTVKSLAEAGEAVKRFAKKETTRPSRFEEAGRDPNTVTDKKQEKRHRETIKWTKIGIGVAIGIAIVSLFFL